MTKSKQDIRELIIDALCNSVLERAEDFANAVTENLKKLNQEQCEGEFEQLNEPLRKLFDAKRKLGLNSEEKIKSSANAGIFSRILDWVVNKIHTIALKLVEKPIIGAVVKPLVKTTTAAHNRVEFRNKINNATEESFVAQKEKRQSQSLSESFERQS